MFIDSFSLFVMYFFFFFFFFKQKTAYEMRISDWSSDVCSSDLLFFNRIVAPKFLGREGDLAAADVAEKDELPKLLAYLEGAIPASGFMVGDRLTLADLAVASPMLHLRHCGAGTATAAQPKMPAWREAGWSRRT